MEHHNFSLKLSKVREERRSLKPHLATKINNLISEVPAVQGSLQTPPVSRCSGRQMEVSQPAAFLAVEKPGT